MTIDPDAVPISLSYYTVPELDALATVEVAAAAGCGLVGLRLLGGQPGENLPPLMTDPALRREMRRCLAASGIAALDGNTARLVPTTEVARFHPFLDVAAELGAKHVLASGNDPERARLVANFAALAEAAAARGLTVEIEFVPWMAVPDLAAAAAIVAEAKHPALGICVDALHFQRSHGSLAAIAAVPAGKFRYMQICDGPARWDPATAAMLHDATKERLFPGEGAIDLVGLLRALPHGIPVALEIPTETLARTVDAGTRVRRAVAATRRVLRAAFAA